MESSTADRSSYLSDRMDEVSRTFALVVRSLEQPLRDQLSTAYLLCRVADNIEDCGRPQSWRAERFEQFRELLVRPEAASGVLAEWELLEWPGLSAAESRIMGTRSGLPLWQLYTDLDERRRASIRTWVSTMATGMENFEDPDSPPQIASHNGVEYLATIDDYNEYCYYVAGTVGHMATELVAYHYGFSHGKIAELQTLSDACGRSLQKTNIIKDFRDDLRRGISYLPGTWLENVDFSPLHLQGAPDPWTQVVIEDVLDDLRDATEYLCRLPANAVGYRMSSLLSLLPAYATVLLAAQRKRVLFTDRHQVKISRASMVRCQLDAKSMVSDNDAIRDYTRRQEEEILATL